VEVAKVTSKGQITIPISIRRKLEINEGDKILFIYKPEGVMMVNPNTMQGGYTGDVVEAAETEMGAEAVAAMKEREAAKNAPKEEAPKAEPPPAAAIAPEEQKYTGAPAQEEVRRRPVPPPIDEPPPKDKHVGGFNLSTLLDDIRSIGSNI